MFLNCSIYIYVRTLIFESVTKYDIFSTRIRIKCKCSDMFQTTVDVVWCFLANRRRCASRSKMKQILLKIS